MKQTVKLTELELKRLIKETLCEILNLKKSQLNENLFGGSDTYFYIDGKDVTTQIHMRPRCSMKHIEKSPDRTKFAFGRGEGGPGNVFYPDDIQHDLNGDVHVYLKPMPTQA